MSVYERQGVDYEVLDAAKRRALQAARATSGQLGEHHGSADERSWGEPAFMFEFAGMRLVQVLEGLGTKSIITRTYEEQTGRFHYDWLARDTVAAIVNDLVCIGARPLVVNAYFATGGDAWYDVPRRNEQLVDGWRDACADAGATWGGGESPSLPGLVNHGHLELAGCATGYLPDGVAPLLGDQLDEGDVIVLVPSSGLHANGASIARALDLDLRTPFDDGATLGEHLLRPSHIYVRLVRDLVDAGAPLHYISHITGHGFRKLMRADRALTYRIHTLPPVPPILRFLAEQTGMDPAEAYGTFNMGAGLAIYCPPSAADAVVHAASTHGHRALVAGHVERGERAVVVEPIEHTYQHSELRLR